MLDKLFTRVPLTKQYDLEWPKSDDALRMGKEKVTAAYSYMVGLMSNDCPETGIIPSLDARIKKQK